MEQRQKAEILQLQESLAAVQLERDRLKSEIVGKVISSHHCFFLILNCYVSFVVICAVGKCDFISGIIFRGTQIHTVSER